MPMRCSAVNRNVLLLALTSFLADVSGEMMMAVLPFLLVAQGASGVGIGLVAGLADAVGHALKPLAGRLSDRHGRRKPLIIGGYLTAALARLGVAFASAWVVSLFFRSVDRVGKGMRTAPRDALLAESVARQERGRAFGLHRAADTAGAVVGVALALAGLALVGESATRGIVLVAAGVGLTTAFPLSFVREAQADPAARTGVSPEPASPHFGPFVAIAALFALGNVSYMFFVLRVRDVTGSPAGAVALYLIFNLVYVAAAYPAGRLADRVGKARVVVMGWTLFGSACLLLVFERALWVAFAAFIVLGFAFAGFEGVQRALAADLAGSDRRGTRLGVFHAAVGLATVLGGLTAGFLWDRLGEWSAFAWGAAASLAAACALFLFNASRATRL